MIEEAQQSAKAIAAVTIVLKGLLVERMADHGVTAQIGSDVAVTALPPNRIAAEGDERPQINVFLYHVAPSAGLPALDLEPDSAAPMGLRLDLFYLLSVHGARDLQIETLLGHSLQRLQEGQCLSSEQTAAILKRDGTAQHPAARRDPAPDVALGALEIRPQFLSMDELSRLWSCFQASYRPSVIYKVSAVTIQERRG